MDGEYFKSPMTGNGAKQTGWYKAHPGPGGFSIIADFEADSTPHNEIGHELLTWDPKKDAYTTVTVGNGFPGASIGIAKWEGDSLVTQTEFGTTHLRAVYSHIGEKTIQIGESYQTGDAPYQLIWKASATRKWGRRWRTNVLDEPEPAAIQSRASPESPIRRDARKCRRRPCHHLRTW